MATILDEDIDERIEAMRAEVATSRWTVPSGMNFAIFVNEGHLFMTHATVITDLLDTIEALKKRLP